MTARVLVEWLFASTLWMTCGCLITWMILTLTRCRQWRIHRLAWSVVLLQGMVCGWFSLEIPVIVAPTRTSVDGAAFNAIAALADRRQSPARPIEQVGRSRAPARAAVTDNGWRRRLIYGSLAAIWFAGWLLYWGRLAVGYLRTCRALRDAWPLSKCHQAEWRTVLRARGYRRAIPLLGHDSDGPMVVWRPSGLVMIVPTTFWATRSPIQRRAILEHEAGHIARRDLLKSLLIRFPASLHWFNPCAHLAARRFDEAAEWACDEVVARRDPLLMTVLARVLLELAAVPNGRIGVSAVRGARLSQRVRRLVSFSHQKESTMKKGIVIAVLLLLLSATAIQFKLVARQIEEGDTSWQRRTAELSRRLSTDDRLSAKLREKLQSPAAVIAVRDRIAGMTERRRESMRREALPTFFDRHFQAKGGELTWRAESQAFRDKFLTATQVFNSDMERIHAALRDLADELGDQSELDRLARRFLTHEGAPVVLYIQEIQRRLRPSDELVADRLGELFAADETYHYFIRAGRRDEALAFVRRAQSFAALESELKQEFGDYEKEFSEQNALDKRMKQALADPLFPPFIAALLFREFDGAREDALREFFQQMNHMAADTADGLSVVDEGAQRELSEVLGTFDRIKKLAPSLQAALGSFVGKITEKGEVEQAWKKFLQTRMALVFLSAEMELPEADAGAAARAMLMPVMRKGDDGKLHIVHPEGESDEELLEHLREMFRRYRMLRLQARAIEPYADKMSDADTAAALRTLGGKALILQEIDRTLKQVTVDVWDEWLAERFDQGEGGWTIKAEAQDDMEELIRDIDSIEQESEKDDF